MSAIKITVQWSESRTFDVHPGDIVDLLDVEASDDDIDNAILGEDERHQRKGHEQQGQ